MQNSELAKARARRSRDLPNSEKKAIAEAVAARLDEVSAEVASQEYGISVTTFYGWADRFRIPYDSDKSRRVRYEAGLKDVLLSVQAGIDGGRPISEIAKQNDVHPTSIYNWARDGLINYKPHKFNAGNLPDRKVFTLPIAKSKEKSHHMETFHVPEVMEKPKEPEHPEEQKSRFVIMMGEGPLLKEAMAAIKGMWN